MQAGRMGNKKTEKADSESPNMGKSEGSLRKPEETEGQPGKGQNRQKAKKTVRKRPKQSES